jgi:hypothetical protein
MLISDFSSGYGLTGELQVSGAADRSIAITVGTEND